MANRELIQLLNQAIELELQAYLQFTYQSLKLTGLGNLALKEMLEEEGQAELGHARTLAERVFALGGEPSQKVPPVKIGNTATEMIKLNIAREEQAIALYRKIVRKLRHKEGTELVYYEVLKILGDELEDLEEYEALLG